MDLGIPIVRTIGGLDSGQFDGLVGLDIDKSGNLMIADAGNRRFQVRFLLEVSFQSYLTVT
jgi:hypothetical protein